VAPGPLKRLEKAGQQLLFGAARFMFPTVRPDAPDWDERPFRVLYLRYDRIGDMIMATGLIRAVATSHASIRLDVLASPANAPVLEGNPHVRQVLLFDRRSRASFPGVLRRLRAAGYDAVIDGMVLTPSVTMMLLMRATGAPWRIGIGGRRNDFVYSLPVPPAPSEAHIIEQSGQTAIPFGVDPGSADWRPELFLRAREREAAHGTWGPRAGPRLLFNVSAVTPDRHWPRERYAALMAEARRLRPGARLLVISAPADRDEAAAMATAAGAGFAPTPGIRDAFALVGTADAVFTPDTSISHAAGALDVPLAVLIPARSAFGPYQARHIRIESDTAELVAVSLPRAVQGLRDLLALADV
jgi:ADP-heptose:LPS heptosyltransferase